jgi:hypothetical protein
MRSGSSAHQQQAVHHVAHKEGLLGLCLLADTDVRQQLTLQDLPRILDARLSRHTWHAPTLAYVIQRHLRN